MSKFYYNGVLLPEIPSDILAEYPYAVMAINKSTMQYQLLLSKSLWYSDRTGITNDENETEPYLYAYEGYDKWETGTSGNYVFNHIDRPILWSNYNIPNGSATSSNIYFYGSEPSVKPLNNWILTDDSSLFSSSNNSFELGTEILCKKTTKLIGARLFVPTDNTLSVKLWDSNGVKIAETSSQNCNGGKWSNLIFLKPMEITEGNSYVISANFTSYYYVDSTSLEFSDIVSFVQSRYQSVNTYPSTTFNQKLYGVIDILYESDDESSSDENESAKYKYLIRSDNTLYTVVDSVLTSLNVTELTSDVFQNHGFNNVPEWSLISELMNPEILYWQSSIEDELPTMTATMTAIPHPQTLVAEPFYLIDSTILGIESVMCEHAGEPLIALSFDGGDFEYCDEMNGWVTASDSEGMIPTVLTGITTDMWSEKITDVRSIQIRVILNSSSDSLTSIKFNFINQ